MKLLILLILLIPTVVHAASFADRCAGATATSSGSNGVVRCWSFDDTAQLGSIAGQVANAWYQERGTFHNSVSTCTLTDNTTPITDRCPIIDTSGIAASGTGSLKFTMVSSEGGAGAGQWYSNLSSDFLTQFGAGDTFYVQWRQRFDDNYVTYENTYTDTGQGPKQFYWTGGSKPACLTTKNSSNCGTSNVPIEIVTQDVSQRGFIQMYGNLGGQQYRQFYGPGEYSDFNLQSERPRPPGCWQYWYFDHGPAPGSCFLYHANEWMTFKIRVTLGSLVGGTTWQGSHIQLWGAREGQASEPIIDVTEDLTAADSGWLYGKVWIAPYVSDKTGADVTTPVMHTWYDELIVSTQDIADPTAQNAVAVGGKISVGGKAAVQH